MGVVTGTEIRQAPALPGAQFISASDRVYTADQTSNTVTVIKPLTNEVLGTITLGKPRVSDQFNPQYLGVINSHGLGFSLDGQFLSHVAVTTNTLTVIRTSNNSIVSQTSVGRAAHEAFFTHDNRTVWVACRGTNFVDIVDGIEGKVISQIKTEPGPSKVLFSPDGKTAYVNHIKSPTLSIIDVETRKVIYTIKGLAHVFSSDMMISADGLRLWAVHKMIGKTTVINLEDRTVVTVLDTGEESNHPMFAVINGTTHAFVTVAASNNTKVWRQDRPSSVPVFVQSIPAGGIEPHGIWVSPDNTRIYWVNEHSDTLDIVDTSSFKVISTVKVGQESQAVVYVAGAVPSTSYSVTGIENLGTQGLGKRVENRIIRVIGSPRATALFTIRELDGLDMIQVIGRTLEINQTYIATAICKGCRGNRLQILSFNATMPIPGEMGCAVAPQVLSYLPFFSNYDVDSIALSKA
ncbi:40-residue YVTN family beta-propeller repeat protein [Tricladium varicosporioides]|nr:40-residue YVTN family beta-propeller repeat protein [Hymenoscyphus varicosporioides]